MSIINAVRNALHGHPKGVLFIVFTEAWERFSFYGMQALLVLYMGNYLLQPGNIDQVIGYAAFHGALTAVFGELSIKALAAQIFGLYVAFVYLMPILGGLLGDRVLGQKNAVLLGAAFMAAGHFMMAFEPLFLFALSALIIGSGLLKGNLAAQVGQLYERGDPRRDEGYVLYNLAINIGATLAPIVCGTLGMVYGWHYGFSAAGLGMLVSIVIYVRGLGHMPKEAAFAESGDAVRPLTAQDYKALGAILLMIVVASFFWTAQLQVYNTYHLWAQDNVHLEILGAAFQVPWFHAIDSFAVLLFGPLVVVYWGRLRARGAEPNDLKKIAFGCVFIAICFCWLALGVFVSGEEKVNLFWPIVFHFFCAIGFLHVGPVVMSLISRAAPASVNAMMVSAYYLALFAGGIVSGSLGRFYEATTGEQFWLMHGAIAAFGGVIVAALYPLLKKHLGLAR